jgi:hypothetical protein
MGKVLMWGAGICFALVMLSAAVGSPAWGLVFTAGYMFLVFVAVVRKFVVWLAR